MLGDIQHLAEQAQMESLTLGPEQERDVAELLHVEDAWSMSQ